MPRPDVLGTMNMIENTRTRTHNAFTFYVQIDQGKCKNSNLRVRYLVKKNKIKKTATQIRQTRSRADVAPSFIVQMQISSRVCPFTLHSQPICRTVPCFHGDSSWCHGRGRLWDSRWHTFCVLSCAVPLLPGGGRAKAVIWIYARRVEVEYFPDGFSAAARRHGRVSLIHSVVAAHLNSSRHHVASSSLTDAAGRGGGSPI